MFKYLTLLLLGMALTASAQSFLNPEGSFLGMPNVESLSNGWFVQASDSTQIAFTYPTDVHLLKLSDLDYRVVILNADSPYVRCFRLEQQFGLSPKYSI